MKIIMPSLALLLASCGTLQSGASSRGVAAHVPASPRASGEALLAEAQMHYRGNNIASALSAFRKAARELPDRSEPLHGLASCYDLIGRHDLARRYFEEALGVDPANKGALAAFALSLDKQGLTSEAAQLLRDFNVPFVLKSAAPISSPARLPRSTQPTFGAPSRTTLRPTRLERSSLGEVALITRRGAAMPPVQAEASVRRGLRIMNGVGRRGQATRMAQFLRERGMRVSLVGDLSGRPAVSVIRFSPERRPSAVALAVALPFPVRMERAPPGAEMQLVLGANAREFDAKLLHTGRS